MPSDTPPLRIAVIGAGNIGSTFAFQLARTGRHEVTVIARPGSNRLRQLERDGAIVDIRGNTAKVSVESALDEQIPYDLIIVTLMAHQVDQVLPSLQRSAAKSIQFMFNTFDPDRLRRAIGDERCAFGMPFVQAMLDADGRLKATIGAGGQKSIMSERRWVEVFNASGIPAAFEPDMPLWLRCHAPVCVALESVCVAGKRRNGGASWRKAMVLARGVRTCFALVTGLGYTVYPKSKARMAGSPILFIAAFLWIMSRIRSFRDLLATGEAECRALVDAMVAAAPLAKPPVATAEIEAMRP